jgi:hypothetical protein
MKPYLVTTLLLTGPLLVACGGIPGGFEESAAQTEVAAQVLTALAPAETEAPVADATAAPTDTAAPVDSDPEPVIVFQPGGLFTEDQRNILLTRVVNPFILYHQGIEGHPPLVSISIEPSSALADYPYSANAIFETSITAGWLIRATGGAVDWWLPDCLGPCPLSDAFRTAYPEIVSTLEP